MVPAPPCAYWLSGVVVAASRVLSAWSAQTPGPAPSDPRFGREPREDDAGVDQDSPQLRNRARRDPAARGADSSGLSVCTASVNPAAETRLHDADQCQHGAVGDVPLHDRQHAQDEHHQSEQDVQPVRHAAYLSPPKRAHKPAEPIGNL